MFWQKSADLIGNFNALKPFLHQMMMFSSVSCHSTAVRFFLIRKFINQTRRAQKSPSDREELIWMYGGIYVYDYMVRYLPWEKS